VLERGRDQFNDWVGCARSRVAENAFDFVNRSSNIRLSALRFLADIEIQVPYAILSY
jgi:hypothetical protein